MSVLDGRAIDDPAPNGTASSATPPPDAAHAWKRFPLHGANDDAQPLHAADSPIGWAARLDSKWVRLGDGLNPILVKETRQALKSKQFAITFMLTLAVGLFWSAFGVLGQGESIHYSASGSSMFLGYYVMLLFPLLVIVPIRAMRSLASEIEDSTHELLEITTLRADQVIVGKLGSAVLQMGIYFAALAPCMAFTYLLQGIDLLTIFYLFFWAFQASIGLSIVGLTLASAGRGRRGLNALTAFALMGFMYAFGAATSATVAVIQELPQLYSHPIFWGANATAFVVLNSYLWLFAAGAWSQLRFASANRSTPLRVAMVVQQAVFTGIIGSWIHFVVRTNNASLTIGSCVLVLFGNAYVMGTLLLGESADVSERVRRTLPQTYVARMLLTWFFPGPGTGFLFAISNLLAAAAVGGASLATVFAVNDVVVFTSDRANYHWICLFQLALIGGAYAIFFLGVGNLLMLSISRWIPRSRALSLAIQALLVLSAIGIPELIEQLFIDRPPSGFWMLHAFNPYAGISEAIGPHIFFQGASSAWIASSSERDILLFAAPIAAFVVMAANVPLVLAQVRLKRAPKPSRVAEEDSEAHARANPVVKAPTSPWDEELPG